MSQDDPVRWLEQPSQLSSELARAMSRYAEHGPGAELHAAQRAALLRKLGAPSLAPSAQGLAGAGSWSRSALLFGTLVLAATCWWWFSSAGPVQPVVSKRAPLAPAALTSAPAPGPTASPRFDVAPVQSAPPVSNGGASEAGAPPIAPPRTATHRARTVTRSGAEDELALLARARRTLRSAPRETLRMTELHRRRFTAPAFAQERELLAIEALVRGGEHAQAAERARRFEERYPRSLHRERLRVLLAPLLPR